jgi:hypothetical protein
VRSWGSPNSDDWRIGLTLCLLCGSQCLELRAKQDIIGLTFQVSRYFIPAFNHTEEVPSYFQTAMGHSQVEKIGQVSGGPLLPIRCLLKSARVVKLASDVH